ncbi:uncharacterized protein B0I36DRAFT_351894 [Microdochium trichocladiopsis]|uniref:Uncharacterized protein n=1 Tax=Microdochium trichocladiopsis TaxID=1682393 RepID=A0A9P8Y2G8_9PEZI|nr:uncharacterized protein B0I36DRAFT_351894 [Microdochium trichocladiopsis]KAH7025958.1 hypothetical protein B0I36DRAFT_351894 [Microdochium trichocladiopsis]
MFNLHLAQEGSPFSPVIRERIALRRQVKQSSLRPRLSTCCKKGQQWGGGSSSRLHLSGPRELARLLLQNFRGCPHRAFEVGPHGHSARSGLDLKECNGPGLRWALRTAFVLAVSPSKHINHDLEGPSTGAYLPINIPEVQAQLIELVNVRGGARRNRNHPDAAPQY